MSTYTKSALDTPDLLAILKQRGLTIADEAKALSTLSVISYLGHSQNSMVTFPERPIRSKSQKILAFLSMSL